MALHLECHFSLLSRQLQQLRHFLHDGIIALRSMGLQAVRTILDPLLRISKRAAAFVA